MKIITITLNPAYDVHLTIEDFKVLRENYAKKRVVHAGGKGVNISRTLNEFGVLNTAYVVLGDENSEEFKKSLSLSDINFFELITKGRIRENITVHSLNGETRISLEGFCVEKRVLDEIFSEAIKNCDENTVLTFTGRLPSNDIKDEVISYLEKIKNTGAKLIVDSNSFNADELFRISPYLIKPNEEEIKLLTDKNTHDAAEWLFRSGVRNVIISLGSKGFLYTGENGKYKVSVPEIQPVSTIGAGDSTIAGFIYGLFNRYDFYDILKTAAAFGSAACLAEGTNPPEKDDVLRILKEVKCEKIS